MIIPFVMVSCSFVLKKARLCYYFSSYLISYVYGIEERNIINTIQKFETW